MSKISTTQISDFSSSGTADLTADWAAAAVKVVIEGDSIAALLNPSVLDDYPAFSAAKATITNVGVNGSYMGNPGEGGNNVYDRYTANVYPKRPAANGGSSGVLESWIILMVGTNHIMWNELADTGGVNGFSTRILAYISRARGHGFKVAICTIYVGAGFHDAGGSTPYTNDACSRAAQYNRWFRTSSGADLIIPLDTAIAGITDAAVSGDLCHLSGTGVTRFAQLTSDTFRIGETVKPVDAGLVKGSGYDAVATHAAIERTVHTYRSAQGSALQIIPFASTISCDLDSLPFPKITLTADAVITAVNLRSGFRYSILLQQGTNTITWDTMFRFRGGDPTLSTGNVYDLLHFWSDGNYLHFENAELAFDLTIPAPPGVVVQESFLQTGAVSPGVSLSGTAPDTANVPGHLWYNPGSVGLWRKYDANNGYGGGNNVDADGCFLDIDRYDNYSVEWTVVTIPTPDTDDRLNFRRSPTVANTAYIKFSVSSDHYAIDSFPAGGGASTQLVIDYRTFSSGDALKLTFQGTVIKFYQNGTLRATLASSDGNTSSNDGVQIQKVTSITDFIIKDI